MRKTFIIVLLVMLSASVGQAYQVWSWDMLGHMPEIAVDARDYGPRLLLSDNPETTAECGVLYQDYVYGATRLFMHHVNAAEAANWIGAVLQNDGDDAVAVQVTKHAYVGPGLDYSAIGKTTNSEYFSFNAPYSLIVPAHGAIILDGDMLKQKVERDKLITGMYDFYVNGRLLCKTVMAPGRGEFVDYALRAKVLPKENQHPRGTFPAADRAVFFKSEYQPLADGLCALTLADGIIDKFQTGIDGITGEKVTNYGNYGVRYRLFITATDGQPYNIYLNPWGGTYGGALAYRVPQSVDWLTINTPRDRTVFAENTIYHVEFVSQINNELVTQLLFSPPGASNLPVKLLFAPPDFDLNKYAADNHVKYAKEEQLKASLAKSSGVGNAN